MIFFGVGSDVKKAQKAAKAVKMAAGKEKEESENFGAFSHSENFAFDKDT